MKQMNLFDAIRGKKEEISSAILNVLLNESPEIQSRFLKCVADVCESGPIASSPVVRPAWHRSREQPAMGRFDDSTKRRVCPAALEEAEELVALSKQIVPTVGDREHLSAICRAFGWPAQGSRCCLFAAIFATSSSGKLGLSRLRWR